jgi:ferredoxin/flavodoxin---NADP+ reductase
MEVHVSETGSAAERMHRVAAVGSGPAGFFAAEALFRAAPGPVEVDVFDRLPTPFGLVRGGVAPDHQRIKGVARTFETTAAREGFRFFGNVRVGHDLSPEALGAHYDQVIYAVGNEASRRLGIPGEGILGSTPAAVFVGWYNGHPDYRTARFDLSGERAVVVGNGNVAVDVARLLVRPPEQLAPTDIADYALAALYESRVRHVTMLGRRGPAQAAFTPKELGELAALEGVDVVVDPGGASLTPDPDETLTPAAHKNLKLLRELADRPSRGADRVLTLRFCASPTAIEGAERVSGVEVERNRLVRAEGRVRPEGTGERSPMPCELVLTAVGYQGEPLEGLPFDATRRRVQNVEGRVAGAPDTYVVGWARSGPTGLIGTHRAASAEVVAKLLADHAETAPRTLPPRDALPKALRAAGVELVSFDDWRVLDSIEQARGRVRSAPRRKIADVDEMLAHLRTPGRAEPE